MLCLRSLPWCFARTCLSRHSATRAKTKIPTEADTNSSSPSLPPLSLPPTELPKRQQPKLNKGCVKRQSIAVFQPCTIYSAFWTSVCSSERRRKEEKKKRKGKEEKKKRRNHTSHGHPKASPLHGGNAVASLAPVPGGDVQMRKDLYFSPFSPSETAAGMWHSLTSHTDPGRRLLAVSGHVGGLQRLDRGQAGGHDAACSALLQRQSV